MAQPWTKRQEYWLRQWYPRYPVWVTARLCRRPYNCVRQKARKLGLRSRLRRPWTEADLAELRRRREAGETLSEIAGAMGRAASTVDKQMLRMGCRRYTPVRTDAAWQAGVRRLAPTGICNKCLARELGGQRTTYRHWRRKLGLPSSPGNNQCPRCVERTREAIRRQLERGGFSSLAELKHEALRLKAERMGWPGDLPWRCVQMLEALYAHGPQTRRELADRLGMPWKGVRKSLTANTPEGTYLGHLVNRGLVVRLGRRVVGRGYLYAVALWVERGRVS